jgi:pilus assembly protein CpaE
VVVSATRDQAESAVERPLTTLLVSSDPEVLETMRRALTVQGFSCVGEAWPGIDAARRAAATQPDVVVLHVEDPLVPALRTVQAIAEACPAGIAVVSSLTEIETVRRVMNAGAHDFATLPLTDDQLQDAVIRASRTVERRRSGTTSQGPAASSAATGTVITVAGPRGGVGKTLIAANLAIEIARLTGTAVAIADLDITFGGIAATLDVLPPTGLREWLSEHASRPNAPLARHLTDHHSGLRVLAAPSEPQAGIPFTPSDVADLVADLSGTHEYVILDTPASFSEVTAAAIDLAPLTLIVTSPDLPALRASRFLVETLRSWDIQDERLRLVLNHPTEILKASHEEAQGAVGIPVAWELPYDANALKALSAGVPVSDYKPGSDLPQELREIARFVAGVSAPRATRRRLLGVI